MTGQRLSEDFSDWPSDPFDLLGVARDADERQVRRAYIALIRQFHPEERPEHFRRIREAFEQIKTIQERGFGISGVLWSEPAPNEQSDEENAGAVVPEKAGPSTDMGLRMARAWESACAGDFQGAELLLQQLSEEYPRRPELWIRRYWLSILAGSAPFAGNPLSILEDFLEESFDGHVATLYKNFLESHAELSTTSRTWEIATRHEMLEWLPRILEIRWRELAMQGKLPQVEEELFSLETLTDEHDWHWRSILLIAYEIAAFLGAAQFASRIQRALGDKKIDVHGSHFFMSFQLERESVLEMLLSEASKQLKVDRKKPYSAEDYVRLVRDAAMQPDCVFLRRISQGILPRWMESPQKSLKELDQFQLRYPVHAYEFWARLQRVYFSEARFYTDSDELAVRVRADIALTRHLHKTINKSRNSFGIAGWPDYNSIRWPLFAFCREEHATLEQLGDVLSQVLLQDQKSFPDWHTRLVKDRALAILVLGYLLLWV